MCLFGKTADESSPYRRRREHSRSVYLHDYVFRAFCPEITCFQCHTVNPRRKLGLSGTPSLVVTDATTGQSVPAQGPPYTGPVAGLQQEYIGITTDKLAITASTPNWFIAGGS